MYSSLHNIEETITATYIDNEVTPNLLEITVNPSKITPYTLEKNRKVILNNAILNKQYQKQGEGVMVGMVLNVSPKGSGLG